MTKTKTFRHKSFLFGVTLASITWAASFYLYLTLTSTSSSPDKVMVTSTTTTVNNPNNEDFIHDIENVNVIINNNKLSSSSIGMGGAEMRPNNYFPKNMVIDPPQSENEESTSAEKSLKNDNNQNQQRWRQKFQQLISLQGNYQKPYKNSDKLLKSLKSKVNLQLQEDDNRNETNELGLIKTPEEKKIREEGYRKHAFNALISERIGFHRSITDTRHPLCKLKPEQPPNGLTTLPSASIIICFYNEEFNTLIRSIHSILDRSNPHEIIMLDDFSDHDLHAQVEKYAQLNLPSKVKVLKTSKREGLIRARILGAKEATGDVLIFLDSHIEANVNWMEPLLTRISHNNHTIAAPIIDLINADTFDYSSSPLVKGGFNWGLHFRWDNVPREDLKTEEDFIKPIASPTISGGLFAIDRKYFFSLGEYDKGMDIWGGENLELSFRTWMCGGKVEIIPCSRVGHVFRKRRPYGGGDDSILKNSIRLAEVWLDEYKSKFYEINPSAPFLNYGDISSRIELRRKLSCKSFKWYLTNVYPHMTELKKPVKTKMIPWNNRQRHYIQNFALKFTGTNLCVESEREITEKNGGLILNKCHGKKKQRWAETDRHEFVLSEMLCLDAEGGVPKVSKCHEMRGTQEWRTSGDKGSAIFSMAAGECLGVEGKPIAGKQLKMIICDEKSMFDLVEI